VAVLTATTGVAAKAGASVVIMTIVTITAVVQRDVWPTHRNIRTITSRTRRPLFQILASCLLFNQNAMPEK
jgi:hypothetical protein